jgi:hypothetical protein
MKLINLGTLDYYGVDLVVACACIQASRSRIVRLHQGHAASHRYVATGR